MLEQVASPDEARQACMGGRVRSLELPGLIRFLLSLAALAWLFGCSFHVGLKASEREALQGGNAALVILRLTCNIDGQPLGCFGKGAGFTDSPIVILGLGSFETVGEPRPTEAGFLSETSRMEGWVYLVLPPGAHYVAVMGPSSNLAGDFRKMPRWRIDVPRGKKFLYAGSVALAGHDLGGMMFEGKDIEPAAGDHVGAVTDERALAHEVLAAYTPGAAAMSTRLMVRWHPGEPLIIRTPRSEVAN